MKTAILLASGRGERMMPLTKKNPKPLIKIAGKPMIEYAIEILASHGIKLIGINLFYLSDQIKKYLGGGKKYGVNITYVEEDFLTGTAGGIKNVAKVLNPKEPFFAISSDILMNFPLDKVYKFHLKHGGIATLCCYFRPKEAVYKSGIILFDKKRRIKKFLERPKTEAEIISQWVNSSVYVFSPKILDYIPDEIDGSAVVDLAKHVFPTLLKKEKMFAYPIDGKKYYQLGIDTPDRIERAETDIKSGSFKPYIIRSLTT